MPIVFRALSYVYSPKSPFEFQALKGIDLTLEDGKFIALVGRTGSGKSTLIQQINALLRPTAGEVEVAGFINSADKKRRSKKINDLRKRVGLVFQFPEYQLFESTVEKDVAFGPKNFGASKQEALQKAHDALKRVGLGESFFERSPFELSGGEKRKVAIAGILAMEPDVLIVDEPTAGLDPAAAKDTMSLFKEINAQGVTIILVSHDMDLVLAYADIAVVMDHGEIKKVAPPSALFDEDLTQYSLQNPRVFAFAEALRERGMHIDLTGVKDVDDLAKAIKEIKRG